MAIVAVWLEVSTATDVGTIINWGSELLRKQPVDKLPDVKLRIDGEIIEARFLNAGERTDVA